MNIKQLKEYIEALDFSLCEDCENFDSVFFRKGYNKALRDFKSVILKKLDELKH